MEARTKERRKLMALLLLFHFNKSMLHFSHYLLLIETGQEREMTYFLSLEIYKQRK